MTERDWILYTPRNLDPRRIAKNAAIKAAAKHDVRVSDIFAETKVSQIVSHARQEAMAACRAAGLSYPDIGAQFGRDHTTVMYAVKAVAKRKEGTPA